ncbi:hypothetical protein AAVH_22822 [Aphelenchoides avenae]|nr:hypothetical protein AAVH_22822 [Aphelenchus avenae]
MGLSARFVLFVTSLCVLSSIAYGKIEGVDKARSRKIGKNGLPDTNVVINADESKPADCGFGDPVKPSRGSRRFKRQTQRERGVSPQRRIRFTPDGDIAVDAGDGSDVKVTAKEGPGWQVVAVSERCKPTKKDNTKSQ